MGSILQLFKFSVKFKFIYLTMLKEIINKSVSGMDTRHFLMDNYAPWLSKLKKYIPPPNDAR